MFFSPTFGPSRLWWLRLDHPLLLREDLGGLVRAVLESSGGTDDDPTILFLDEVVYARDWDLWLKTFYDDRWPVRVVATSSATAALRERRLESGVGRRSEQYLMPYLFSEFLDLLGAEVDIEVGPTLAATLEGLHTRPSTSLSARAVATSLPPRQWLPRTSGRRADRGRSR